MKRSALAILLVFGLVVSLSSTASANLTVIGQGTITSAGGYGSGGVGQTVDLVYSSLLGATILNFSNPAGKWAHQLDWVSNLMVDIDINGDGITDIPSIHGWRLPETYENRFNLSGSFGYEGDPNGDGYYNYGWGYNMDLTSEMARLFYDELGNSGYYDTNGIHTSDGLTNAGPLTALITGGDIWYWSGTEHSLNLDEAWVFYFALGSQYRADKDIYYRALAVLPGFGSEYVPNVPVPAAAWLLGSGLFALLGLRRKINS